MRSIHTYLMTHTTKTTFFIPNFVCDTIQIIRKYCEDYLNNNVIDKNSSIGKFGISNTVNFYNRNAYIQYHFYHS